MKFSCEKAPKTKREFQTELKSYSEKILFLANNLIIVTQQKELSDGDTSNNTDFEHYKLFVSVLQAIGNTTRVLIEDIERQELYRNKPSQSETLIAAIDSANRNLNNVAKVHDQLTLWLANSKAQKQSLRLSEALTTKDKTLSECKDNPTTANVDESVQCKTDAESTYKTAVENESEPEKVINLIQAKLSAGQCPEDMNKPLFGRAEQVSQCLNKQLGNTSEKQQWTSLYSNFLTDLKSINQPVNLPDKAVLKAATQNSPQNSEQSKVVWDGLLNYLAIERIVADKRGASAEELKALNKALETARYFRSETSFLRATSDAIRMTLRSTDLLDDQDISTLREIINEPLVKDPNDKNSQILEKLDNQFWHNVNRVALKGGGDVNYVVAKDDIGNWYIKQYAEDKKEIMEGIKGVALFNTRLQNQLRHQPFLDSTDLGDAQETSTEKVYNKFLMINSQDLRNKYLAQLNTIKALLDTTTKVASEKIDFSANKSELSSALDGFTESDSGKMKQEVAELTRHTVASSLLQNNAMLAKILSGIGECKTDAVPTGTNDKEDCVKWRGQIEQTIKAGSKAAKQHLAQVESYILSFSAALECLTSKDIKTKTRHKAGFLIGYKT